MRRLDEDISFSLNRVFTGARERNREVALVAFNFAPMLWSLEPLAKAMRRRGRVSEKSCHNSNALCRVAKFRCLAFLKVTLLFVISTPEKKRLRQ